MTAWVELNEAEHNAIWDRFEDVFDFRPSVSAKSWPGIKEPVPSRTYSITDMWDREHEEKVAARFIAAFRGCLTKTERLYVLDWQHPCYSLDPRQLPTSTEPGLWPIPIIPNGDYSIFLAPDFRFGTFGHPWEETLCIFGRSLLDALARDIPTILTRPVRVDGKPLP